ncbi:MAG: type II toxin-antitoxin system CcdA family antitoxin [Trichlorobacter sp.]
MALSSAKRNVNISLASENAEFVKQIGLNLSKAVDAMIAEMRRARAREAWLLENQEALKQRCSLLEAEGGTAAERLYGVQSVARN